MATGFGGGTGTEADPYLITSASELAYLSSTCGTTIDQAEYNGCYFLQTTDINLCCHMGVEGDYPPTTSTVSYDEDYAGYLEVGDSWSEYDDGLDETTVYKVINVYDWYDSEDWIEDDSYDEGGYYENITHTICDIQIDIYTMQLWKPLELNAHYDGGGHIIANLMYNQSLGIGLQEAAFWRRMYNGSIKNLTLQTIRVRSLYPGYRAGLLYDGGIDNDGANVIIENCHVVDFIADKECYGFLAEYIRGTIKDCSVRDCSGFSYAGVVFELYGTAENIVTDNVNIQVSGELSNELNAYFCFGGLFVRAQGAIIRCASNTNMNLSIKAPVLKSQTVTVGGVIGEMSSGSVTKCAFYGNIVQDLSSSTYLSKLIVGGVIGDWGHSSQSEDIVIASENIFAGNIKLTSKYNCPCYVGGIIGVASDDSCTASGCTLANNLSNGTIDFQTTITSQTTYIGGFLGIATNLGNLDNYCNNISNTTLIVTKTIAYLNDYIGGFYGADSGTSTGNKIFVYNESRVNITKANINNTYGSITDDAMKDPATFADWIDFYTYWIIDDRINDGYPMLLEHLSSAKVTGFDGSGTQADPYQIKTTADLQGMQAYYNEYPVIDEYWWILVNDIDISLDTNGLTINWCPIGYEGGVLSGFNGHFDGNGKTISGLTITEQYENVGLFGRLASNATITNLKVSGIISWDQSKYVGGVVGLMEDGASLTNCSFTGTITGYLNSGNIAVVGGLAGKYGTDAITGSANYDCYVYGADNYTTFNRYSSTYAVA